jgi:hypothetical protein
MVIPGAIYTIYYFRAKLGDCVVDVQGAEWSKDVPLR